MLLLVVWVWVRHDGPNIHRCGTNDFRRRRFFGDAMKYRYFNACEHASMYNLIRISTDDLVDYYHRSRGEWRRSVWGTEPTDKGLVEMSKGEVLLDLL